MWLPSNDSSILQNPDSRLFCTTEAGCSANASQSLWPNGNDDLGNDFLGLNLGPGSFFIAIVIIVACSSILLLVVAGLTYLRWMRVRKARSQNSESEAAGQNASDDACDVKSFAMDEYSSASPDCLFCKCFRGVSSRHAQSNRGDATENESEASQRDSPTVDIESPARPFSAKTVMTPSSPLRSSSPTKLPKGSSFSSGRELLGRPLHPELQNISPERRTSATAPSTFGEPKPMTLPGDAFDAPAIVEKDGHSNNPSLDGLLVNEIKQTLQSMGLPQLSQSDIILLIASSTDKSMNALITTAVDEALLQAKKMDV